MTLNHPIAGTVRCYTAYFGVIRKPPFSPFRGWVAERVTPTGFGYAECETGCGTANRRQPGQSGAGPFGVAKTDVFDTH